MTHKLIKYSFYILFFLTPLFFTKFNHELFEYNKMILTYFLTVAITGGWVLKMVFEKRFIFRRTPLDIPLILFFISQVLATIFSIDPHTSFWGYYSRSNGGLLSILSYVLLFYAFVSNFDKEDAIKFLKVILFSGFLVSLYAIPEAFGYSPSCAILTSQLNASCWVQDVQARVFATLGQPNWLAAYLAMLIFPAMYFFITAKNLSSKIYYFLILMAYYLAFTFTYSRGASLGLIGGMGVFWGLLLLSFLRKQESRTGSPIKSGMTILMGFALITILFGSALTGDFKLIKKYAPARPALVSTATTQLETGGTESGQIRLIVWEGALQIFRQNPILGSGVETFAYAYYQVRPNVHNYVSEWDFLYNKAHNEYLNFLATTGIVGFGAYIILILTFIFFSFLRILNFRFFIFHDFFNVSISKKESNDNTFLFVISILSSYTSFLIQNFFLFSVVVTATLFFLFPAFVFTFLGAVQEIQAPKAVSNIFGIIYKRGLYKKIVIFIVVLFMSYYSFNLAKIWIADTLFKQGSDYADAGNPGRAYNYLIDAVRLNSREPLFLSELGYAAASSALALQEEDATTSSQLKDDAEFFTEAALQISPFNTSLWRTAIRTYYELSILDPNLEQKSIDTIDKTIALAPTDPKLYYNKGLVLSQIAESNKESNPEKYKEYQDRAIQAILKSLELKNNYREGRLTLAEEYIKIGELEKAKENADFVLKMIPNDPHGLMLLDQIASASAEQ